jgi:hypothetical protein
MITGGTSGAMSGCTREDRSNSMKVSAFSCGDRSWLTQPLGNGSFPESPVPEATCRSLNTMRPHSGAPIGVVKEKYCTTPVWLEGH